MKKSLLLVLLLGMATTSAYADTIYHNCTSPSVDANPPSAGSLPLSTCGAGFQTAVNGNIAAIFPGGATLDSITLLSRYSVALQLGGAAGSADFRHATNVGVTNFDNVGFDVVTNPLKDNQWGGGADLAGTSFGCGGGNAATCAAIVAAMQAGTVTLATDFQNAGGQASGVSTDYAWVINYSTQAVVVPEPMSLSLLSVGLLAWGISRRFVRR
jgi:hypothetical protein